MVANIVIEMASDGGFSCYMQESVPYFALLGYGESAKEAKDDLLQSYEEIKEMLKEDGIEAEELTFVWHYDIKSFFDYFDFLNVSIVETCISSIATRIRLVVKGELLVFFSSFTNVLGIIVFSAI